MRKAVIALMVLIGMSASIFAQIPKHPNKIDAAGKKQGMFTFLYDANWNVITKPDSAVFYRIAKYKDDQPLGITRDYYKNGTVQWEGRILQDDPQILDSLIIQYNEDGSVLRYDYYVKGEYEFLKTLDNYNALIAQYRSNTAFSRPDFVGLLSSLGNQYVERGYYEQAEPLLVEAIQVQKKIGTDNLVYAQLLDDLAANA